MIPTEERLEFLRDIPIFAGLKPDALRDLAGHITEASFPAGALVFQEGEPGSELFVIHTGRVEVIKHLGVSRETTLAKLKPGDFFGEMAVIERVARSASVRAAKRTLLLSIRATQLHQLFVNRPDQYAILILNISRDLSRRLRALDENWAEASRRGSLDEAMMRAMEA
jgi:CRP-like cAMP-binding protein